MFFTFHDHPDVMCGQSMDQMIIFLHILKRFHDLGEIVLPDIIITYTTMKVDPDSPVCHCSIKV